ncbi:MAG: tryptophan-rich sensory protein [Pseudomonadota bacterium]|nr:tryptophan-rich sensory protein [Pseudomonadota bacterium]
MSRRKQIIGFVAWLGASFMAAAIGGAASLQAGPFYLQLARPEWAPSPEVFGPVWTVLYALMGISAWLVWRVSRPAAVMLIPYLAWVGFATALNHAMWQLNPQLLG